MRKLKWKLRRMIQPFRRRPLHGQLDMDLVTPVERPSPLGERKRPLTPPASQGELRQQKQSLFFRKLPAEIRLLIYRYVLTSLKGRVLHIISSRRRLLSHRCHDKDPRTPGTRECCSHAVGGKANDGATIEWPGKKTPLHPLFFGLLCSCRRIYTESINILYAENILDAHQTRTVVDFKATILRKRLHSIRSLQLDFQLGTFFPGRMEEIQGFPPYDIFHYAEDAWKAISEMKHLCSLRVIIGIVRVGASAVDQKLLIKLFKLMATVRVPSYILEYYYASNLEEILAEVGEVPFSIIEGRQTRKPTILCT